MNCPACGSTDAYVGFASVECVNSACQHFKAPAVEDLFAGAPDASTTTNKLYSEGGLLSGWARGSITEEVLRSAISEMERASKELAQRVEDSIWGPPRSLEFGKPALSDLKIAVPGEYKYFPLHLYMPPIRPGTYVTISGLGDDDDECRCDSDCNCFDEED